MPSKSGGGRGLAAAFMIAVSVGFWGGSFPVTAIGVEHTSGTMLSALRAVPAAFVLAAALPLLRARFPQGRLWIWSAVTGLLGITLFFVGMSEGTAYAGAANVAVLANTPPFFVLLLGWVFLGERVTLLGTTGLGVGFAGIVVMVSSQLGGRNASELALGMGLALAAAAGWGVTTLIVKWLVERDPKLDLTGLTAGQYLVGGAALIPLAVGLRGTSGTEWSSGELWAALAYLTLGPSVLAYLAFFGALKRATATVVSASLFLVPVVAVLIEVARGNAPGAVVLVGMALAIAGVALVSLAPELEARRSALAPEVVP